MLMKPALEGKWPVVKLKGLSYLPSFDNFGQPVTFTVVSCQIILCLLAGYRLLSLLVFPMFMINIKMLILDFLEFILMF